MTLVGLYGIDGILNYTFIPLALLTLFTIALTLKYYRNLVSKDD
jgi:hypothetical protein